MSERERWIVYPLLFLALGASLRDKLYDRTTAKSIVCQELTVVDEEPIGQQPVRVLARIGRTPSVGGIPSSGYLFVNGQLEVVNEADGGQAPVRILRARTEVAPGNVPFGLLMVNGQLNVDGVVNAKQYAFQGVPFMPALQAVFPGITPDLLRALQQTFRALPRAAEPAEDAPQASETRTREAQADATDAAPQPPADNRDESAPGEPPTEPE